MALGTLGGVVVGVAHALSIPAHGPILGTVALAGVLLVDGPLGALAGALAVLPVALIAPLRRRTGAIGAVGIGAAGAWSLVLAARVGGLGLALGISLGLAAGVWLLAAVGLPLLARWRGAQSMVGTIAVVGAAALPATGPTMPRGSAASPERPAVLLVTIDGARADRYGGHPIDTPAFDRLAAEGVSAGLAVASAPGGLLDALFDLHGPKGPTSPGLPGALSVEGIPAAAVLSEWVSIQAPLVAAHAFHPLDGDTAWPAAFDRTLLGRIADHQPAPTRRSDRTVDRALALWGTLPGQALVWVDLRDPAPPWDPPEPFDQRYAPRDPAAGARLADRARLDPAHAGALDDLTDPRLATALYEGELAWTDRQLGRLLTWLDDTGRASSTLVVVVGTSGMALDEGSVWFGRSGELVDGRVRVPLAMRLPGVVPRGARIEDPVVLADVQATIRDLLGLPSAGDGVSLRQAWVGTGTPRSHAVVRGDGTWAWRQPGLLVRHQEGGGWDATAFPLEVERIVDRSALARIVSRDDVPTKATASEIDRMMRQLHGERIDPTGLSTLPSAD